MSKAQIQLEATNQSNQELLKKISIALNESAERSKDGASWATLGTHEEISSRLREMAEFLMIG